MTTTDENTNAFSSQRLHPRISIHHALRIHVWGHEIKAMTESLSFSGAFITTDVSLPVGTRLELSIDQDDSTASGADARVVHNHGNGCGVSFIDPGEDFIDAIYTAVHHHVVQNVKMGHAEDTVPARIALLFRSNAAHHALFTSHLHPDGVWLLTNRPHAFSDTLWLTLPDRGLFDTQACVEWRQEGIMGLGFTNPPTEFSQAYQRVLNEFLGG